MESNTMDNQYEIQNEFSTVQPKYIPYVGNTVFLEDFSEQTQTLYVTASRSAAWETYRHREEIANYSMLRLCREALFGVPALGSADEIKLPYFPPYDPVDEERTAIFWISPFGDYMYMRKHPNTRLKIQYIPPESLVRTSGAGRFVCIESTEKHLNYAPEYREH